LLVSEGDRLQEVFPCVIGNGNQVEPLEFLTQISSGRPWTARSGRGMEGRKHNALIAQMLSDPAMLEPGLVVRGQNVQVCQDFGELGFIDLVFEDCEGRTLLVEVKVGPNELDKAIGQIMRHRYLFAQQNRVDETSVRMAIACPSIPTHYRSICARVGIICFKLPETITGKMLRE
jgi:RecB family endonuclease NucS